jgi:holo-ACP synthase CitX
MKKSAADKILEAREERADKIDEMIKEYKNPVIVMRVNYPGLNKSNELTISIMKDMNKVISEILGFKFYIKCVTQGAEGPVIYISVSEEVKSLKKIAINIEEKHILGRCLDIDVYDIDGRSISRQELGYEVRKCYLCQEYAHNCVRARVHSEEQVIAYIGEKYREYMEKIYGREE